MSNLEWDHNPYAPPNADVSDRNASLGRRVGWKLYLWLMVIVVLLVFGSEGVRWVQTADLVDLFAVAIATIGLFGFAYRRRIGRRSFWRVWLPTEVIWDFALLFFLEPAGLAYDLSDGEPTSVLSPETAVGVLLILPLYIALYRYAYRSPELWATA